MSNPRRVVFVGWTYLAGLAGWCGAGCSGTDLRGGAPDQRVVVDDDMSARSVTDAGTGPGMNCQGPDDCPNGLCVGGACCPTASVCGTSCCGAGAVCLFDACVTPGKDCHTANDCAPGQYCETALGAASPGDGGAMMGMGNSDGGMCSQPLPLGGKCLSLPPVCDADGGMAPDAGCVPPCEYHPPAGKLDAVPRWQWGPVAQAYPDFTDVWSTPTVGRVYDANCDGVVNDLDPPDIIFVSGKSIDATTGKGTCCQCTNTTPTGCHTGVLRMLDGSTGKEIWSLDKASPNSSGFAGMSIAIGDIDGDGRTDVVAVTGEGYVVLLDAQGHVERTSDKPIPGNAGTSFGWGGGLAIADIDNDGFPEIAYGSTVYTTTNQAITLKFTGANGIGGPASDEAISTFVDLDGAPDNHLELLAGNTAYHADGTILWHRADLPDGFPGVGDFDKDGNPEAVLVANGKVWILDGATGTTVLGPATLPGTGSGGPPTVADFDGDGKPEVGVAMATFYSMMKPDYPNKTLDVIWKTPNHDLSSSVTGSSVFDFDGDGQAEVIYGDECFLWVFDGTDGHVLFAQPHTSFTATEASLVADVDGDGRAEMLMVSNGSDPSAGGSWPCDTKPWNQLSTDPNYGHPAWVPPPGLPALPAYRGLVAFGDRADSWVGTRTLWNEHTYHVSNICDDRDSACAAPDVYGSIPTVETKNWTLPWLDNFRQNVQDKGLFDAPDATVSLTVDCSNPVVLHPAVRNIGLASLPSGVNVGLYVRVGAVDTQVGQTMTTQVLFPGQTQELIVTLPPMAMVMGTPVLDTADFVAKILVDPAMPTFHECRADNDVSPPATSHCVQ